jgi:hypothetical protein
MKSTNYYNTLIEVAEDCTATRGEVPPLRAGKQTIAGMQFEKIYDDPYQFTSDEVLFSIFAVRQGIGLSDLEEEKKAFFSKGQPCFRASPLGKKYGWGVHSNEEGKIAIFGIESENYQKLLNDPNVEKVKAMRSKRK